MASKGNRSVGIFLGIWIAGSAAMCGAGFGGIAWLRGRAAEVREASAPLEVIEDEELRFRLRRPGPSWRLLGRQEAAALNADADAAATCDEHGAGGLVIVEPAYGSDLARATQAIIGSYTASGVWFDEPVAATVSGRDAMRASGRGTFADRPILVELQVVVSEDHVYQLFGYWPELADEPQALTTHLLPAFEILDGPVVDTARPLATADADAPLSRVRDDVLESAAYGLRLRGGEGWFVLSGTELVRSDPIAEGGLLYQGAQVFLVVRASYAPGSDPALARQRLRESTLGSLVVDPAADETRSVAGSPVPFARFRTVDAMPIDHAFGVLVAGDRHVEITAWSAAPGALDAHLEDALARIELMTDAERDALEAASPGPTEDQIGEDIVLRRGRFRGYRWDLGWTAPSSCWRGYAGDDATARESGARMLAECPRRAIRAALWIAPSASGLDPTQRHALAREELGFWSEGEIDPEPVEVSLGDARGLASRGEYVFDGASIAYELRTTTRAGDDVRWAVWYPVAAGEDAAREARAALDAMLVDDDAAAAVSSAPGMFEDRRLGFAIEDRASGVVFEDSTPATLAHARTVSATASRVRVQVDAVHTSGTRGDVYALDAIRTRVRRSAGLFQPEESIGTLGGEPCDVLAWIEGGRRNVMRSATRGSVFYVVVTEGPLFGGDEERWARAFRFVDP